MIVQLCVQEVVQEEKIVLRAVALEAPTQKQARGTEVVQRALGQGSQAGTACEPGWDKQPLTRHY